MKNPSFEDKPYASFVPEGWEDCGFKNFSPPDVHPNDLFFVQKTAFDGQTYVGMVSRDNNTWERIGQALEQPLERGACYGLAIALAKSPIYISGNHSSNQDFNYSKPLKLKIWGAFHACEGLEPLAESVPCLLYTSDAADE